MADQTGILLGDSELKALEDLVRRSGDGGKYGLTNAGFVPKPYAQLLREGLAAARAVLGADVDLAPGSVIRKLVELGALESARTYAVMAGTYDDMFVSTARGPALSRLGDELGLSRPFMRASGAVRLSLSGPAARVRIGRGARLMSRGGHHVFTASGVELTQAAPSAEVEVTAFFPGAAGNLDPAVPDQKIALWNDSYGFDSPAEDKLAELRAAARDQGAANLEAVVAIDQAAPLTGGDARWPDEQYRELLLRLPRSIWTPEAIQAAVSLVPGVRRAIVQDQFGGLDIDRAIFGNL